VSTPGAAPYADRALWQPRSACGPDCLPSANAEPTVSGLRQAARLAALLGVMLLGAALLPVLPVLTSSGRQLAGRVWARGILRAVGVRLSVRGRPPHRRALLVANHISWLDVVAVLAISPSQLLAKREVRDWPLVGPLAAAAGTIFVDRSRPRALPGTVAAVAARLRSGGVVVVFPEGTTWCGASRDTADGGMVGRFRPALFQAALDAGAPVVPLALRYRLAARARDSTAAAFLGDDSLWASLRRVLAVRGLSISATLAATLHPEAGADRRALARIAERAVHGGPVPVVAPIRSAPVGARPVRPEVLDLAA
jgi:1-acyl-sn-glycerol-3-phosphate acyltransferase